MSATAGRVPGRLSPGVHAQVVAADHRPQADRPSVHGLDHVLLLHRRGRGHRDAAGADDAAGATSCDSPDAYNRLFTMHGVVMVFFFLVPSIPAVLGNFLIPLMIGARDLAFPRLNLLSWYIYMIGGSIALWILIFGGVDTGWTFYTPFSTMFSNTMVVPAATAVFITGFSSILTGLNFIVTIHTMRAAGDDLVPAAAVRLGALRHQPDHGPGHAGAGDRRRPGRGGTALAGRDLRPGARGRPDPVPAPVLVLFAPGRVHHGPARAWG